MIDCCSLEVGARLEVLIAPPRPVPLEASPPCYAQSRGESPDTIFTLGVFKAQSALAIPLSHALQTHRLSISSLTEQGAANTRHQMIIIAYPQPATYLLNTFHTATNTVRRLGEMRTQTSGEGNHLLAITLPV